MVNKHMTGAPVRAASRFPRWPARRFAPFLPPALVAVGIALLLLSLTPEVHRVGTVRFDGQLDPGAIFADALNQSGYGFARVAFETRPSCALRLFVLNGALAERYLSSGSLPDPGQSLNCDQSEAVVREAIVLLVFQNSRNESTESYSVIVELFVERLPYGLVAFPATALFILGMSLLIVHLFRGGLRGLEEELRRKDAVFPPGNGEEDTGPAGEVSSGIPRGLRSPLPEGEEAEEQEMQG